MIDRSIETPITLSEAAKLLPVVRAGKHLHVSCLYRWLTNGCRGVLLDSLVVGGTRMTSREALDRFLSVLTASPSRNPLLTKGRKKARTVATRSLIGD